MTVVESWTGAHAAALRAALRLTNEGFAEHLGTATRTVATWNSEPEVSPRAEIQRALDTALERASEAEQTRFELLCAAIGTPPAEPTQLVGWVIERRLSVDIDIAADGWATVTYRHELVNETNRPFSRLPREMWFETTRGNLDLEVLPTDSDQRRRIMIQRVHDSASMTKFACQLLPALEPGESAVVAYRAAGGRFVEDHYWRQSIARPTAEFTMRLRHAGLDLLALCTASEELADGSEISAAEGLFWDADESGVVIGLSRHNLVSNQALTLRWGGVE
ncbi:MAG: hypothetical protein ACRCYU_17805 [Nocardioides sp.]